MAESFGERLAAEGEICWGSLHSWKETIKLLELVGRPQTLGFQADMAHTLLYLLGYNKPEDAILPPNWDWSDPAKFDEAYRNLTNTLRPWTLDFHVAQNDATVLGSGTHEKTGHHCLATDPNGKLNIPHHAGFWMRDASGNVAKAFRHVCWDGCMFPNDVMKQPKTWNDILAAMIAVRDAHGWYEGESTAVEPAQESVVEVVTQAAPPARKPSAKTPAKPVVEKPARKAAPKTVVKKAVLKKVVKKAIKKAVKKAVKANAKATARKIAKQAAKVQKLRTRKNGKKRAK